jgi:hypothetical protein
MSVAIPGGLRALISSFQSVSLPGVLKKRKGGTCFGAGNLEKKYEKETKDVDPREGLNIGITPDRKRGELREKNGFRSVRR